MPKMRELLANMHHKRLVVVVLFLLAWAIASYIFYLRFPNNFVEANFYAEDGRDFATHLLDKGLLGALLTTFNGYFIWGLYLVEAFGFAMNRMVGGSIIQLPQYVAIASYIFLGFTAVLPILLFRKQLKPLYLVALALACCLVPLPASDYAIIGTIGNLKWAFTYIAFLLVVYRLWHTNAPYRQLAAVDVGLLICAYTNATTYLLVPVLVIPYLTLWFRHKTPIRAILRLRSAWGLIGLGLLLLPQVVVVAIKGIPALPGYLDTPFQASRAVEIFIGRSFLYSIATPIYRHLNDLLAVLMFGAMVGALVAWGGKAYRYVYLLGAYAVVVASGLFVMNRPGVSAHFAGYATSGPDQFFYAQNLIVYFVVILGLAEFAKKQPASLRMIAPIAVIGCLLMAAPKTGSWGANNAMADAVGTFSDNAVTACSTTHDKEVRVPVYPVASDGWKMSLPAEQICPHTNRLQLERESFGLAPDNNRYVAITMPAQFTQTFRASEDKLNGVRIFLSTFAVRPRSPYQVVLYDSTCKNVLRRAPVHLAAVHDNRLALVSFDEVPSSRGQEFCFSLEPKSAVQTPLAIQLSKPEVYPTGTLVLESKPRTEDAVFQLNYARIR